MREDELLKIRKHNLDALNDFYERLPNMSAVEAIKEFKERCDGLIDYIIALEDGYKNR